MKELAAITISPDELSQTDIVRWRELMCRLPFLRSAFLSYAYTAIAAQIFYSVRVAKLMLGEETIAFFPFQYRSKFHRYFGWGERISGELADSFGVMADRRLQVTGPELLRHCGLNALYFTHLEESQTRFGFMGEKPDTGLRIEFPEGGEPFWESRRLISCKFTADTARRERKLIEKFGPLEFVYRSQSPLELQELIAAKSAQYRKTGKKDLFACRSYRNFLSALAQSADSDCQGTLSTLHAGRKWIASHFGLTCGNTLHYWFPVYNPEMAAYSPGRLLVKALIDASNETGLRAIDRGAGDSRAKRDFATSEHKFLRGVWNRSGVSAFAYRAGLSAWWRIEAMRAQ